VLDTKTGKRVTDKDGANIRMILPHGEEVIARWTIRGSVNALPDSAWMWDTSWDIPPDYPVGSLDYRIVVTTKDGRTGTFTPPLQKTATADTRVRIIERRDPALSRLPGFMTRPPQKESALAPAILLGLLAPLNANAPPEMAAIAATPPTTSPTIAQANKSPPAPAPVKLLKVEPVKGYVGD